MSFPFDLDLPIFLWTTFNVVFASKGHLRRNTRPVPLRYDFEELPDSKLTAAQREYLRPVDDQLARIGYQPLCTFRAANFGTNLMRRYWHPSDTASCALTVVEVKAAANGVTSVRNASSLEFVTRFSDGRRLITRNMPQKSLFDQPAYRIIQDYPNTTDPARLKKLHDARVSSLGTPQSPPQHSAAVFEELQVEHERYSRFQVEHGIYQMAPDGGHYLVTDKVFSRGIRNHFLPLGRRLSATNVVLSALIGAVLPLFGILKAAPWIAGQSVAALPLNFSGGSFVILSCYALAGLLIGYLCEIETSSWLMLITYVPAHLIAGWTFGWLPYSTIAHLCSHYASQARQRSKLVLQP